MDIIITMVVLVVVWLWGATAGWKARENYATRKLNQLLEQVETDEVNDDQIHISIEKHNGVFYVYGREDNQFMAQAPTIKELEDALQKRYPGKRFACPEKNMIEVGIIS